MANIKQPSIINLKDKKFLEFLIKELVQHGMVKVTGLGVFKLKSMKAHTRYIPGSRKVGKIPARIKLSFKPTKRLQMAIQKYNGK